MRIDIFHPLNANTSYNMAVFHLLVYMSVPIWDLGEKAGIKLGQEVLRASIKIGTTIMTLLNTFPVISGWIGSDQMLRQKILVGVLGSVFKIQAY